MALQNQMRLSVFAVTPRAGVWIEISDKHTALPFLPSLPVRECGLKLHLSLNAIRDPCVTPRAGVWIEILRVFHYVLTKSSLPVRECGLKFAVNVGIN